jgi:hypothetical protein
MNVKDIARDLLGMPPRERQTASHTALDHQRILLCARAMKFVITKLNPFVKVRAPWNEVDFEYDPFFDHNLSTMLMHRFPEVTIHALVEELKKPEDERDFSRAMIIAVAAMQERRERDAR